MILTFSTLIKYKTLLNKVNEELGQTRQWFRDHELSLNVTKTKHILNIHDYIRLNTLNTQCKNLNCISKKRKYTSDPKMSDYMKIFAVNMKYLLLKTK